MLKSQFWCLMEAEAPLTRGLVGCNNHRGTSSALTALNQRHLPTVTVKLRAPQDYQQQQLSGQTIPSKQPGAPTAAPCSQANTGSRTQHGSKLLT